MAGIDLRYKLFKQKVLANAGGECENPHCNADANQVHHFFKTSRYPEFKTNVNNGMAICGSCHSEIERRIRENENWKELIPIDRYEEMCVISFPVRAGRSRKKL